MWLGLHLTHAVLVERDEGALADVPDALAQRLGVAPVGAEPGAAYAAVLLGGADDDGARRRRRRGCSRCGPAWTCRSRPSASRRRRASTCLARPGLHHAAWPRAARRGIPSTGCARLARRRTSASSPSHIPSFCWSRTPRAGEGHLRRERGEHDEVEVARLEACALDARRALRVGPDRSCPRPLRHSGAARCPFAARSTRAWCRAPWPRQVVVGDDARRDVEAGSGDAGAWARRTLA